MIKYIKRQELNDEKYDACINNARNSRIYAYSWYLDCVATNWDALILNDYEAVMPLPWRSKYFIKYIYPPSWTQQLGVFSNMRVDSDLIKKFINRIPKKFKKITIQFNSDNRIEGDKVTERVNYILDLNYSYEELYKGYNKNRKRVLKKVLDLDYVIEKDVNLEDFLMFYLATQKNYELDPNQISSLKRMLFSGNISIQIWGVKSNDKFLGGLIWLKDKYRITYLLPIVTFEAKEIGISILMVNELVKQFSSSTLKLDFEGSMIDGIAKFYKSCGGNKERYYVFQKTRI